jgi:hypothetical protein
MTKFEYVTVRSARETSAHKQTGSMDFNGDGVVLTDIVDILSARSVNPGPPQRLAEGTATGPLFGRFPRIRHRGLEF